MVNYFYGITDVGRQRTNNEDAFIAEPVLNSRYTLACVIDGVGGYAGGEVASALAKEAIQEYFSIPSGDITTMLKESLMAANERIMAEKLQNSEYSSMACVATVVIADIENNLFYYAHVGDTRLYLLRDHSCTKVTKDHSFVGHLEDTGRITEEAAMNHPKRNEINRALGFEGQIGADNKYIETGESPFLPGDILLLCSDGLSDLVNVATIERIIYSSGGLDEKAARLVQEANDRGGKDNITVVLVQHTGIGAKMRPVKPLIKVHKRAPVANAVEEEVPYTTPVAPVEENRKGKSYKGAVIILSILCALFLAGYIWLWFHQNQPVNEAIPIEPKPQLISVRQQNIQEKLLYDSINKGGFTTVLLADSLYTQPITLSNTLFIQKDSVHIKGFEKVILTADSLFTGPAFLLSPNTHYVLLENLVLDGFDVGVITGNKALHLKNVQFRNCRVPLQYQFTFPDSVYVSTTKNAALFKTDSLPK